MPFVVSQLQRDIPISQQMALTSPSKGVCRRRVELHVEQLSDIEWQDGVVGARIDQCPAESEGASSGALDGKRDQGTMVD